MGFMDKVRGMFGQHADKAEGGIDKAGDFIDDKTGDKYTDHVDKGQDAGKDALGKLDDEGRAP
jgi:MT0933-like antitoxin protein